MKIIYGINKIKRFKRPVVALGVFDGVHLGHRNILESAARKAQRRKGTSVVVTFWPHPQREEHLYSLEHRLRLIAQFGMDACIVISFNKKFARVTAQNFIKHILCQKIGAEDIFVGRNFRFGRDAEGDIRTLKAMGGAYHYGLKVFKVIKRRGRPISSTYIRALIKRGELNSAQRLLGRPVTVLGTVSRGIHLGRRLGFPTANINPHHEVIPASGVYAVKIIFKEKKFFGACYIGTRPTLHLGRKKIYVEVYIFNLKKNIYGKYLEIQFIRKIREDKKFNTLTDLAGQIQKDIRKVKRQFRLP